MHTALLGGQMSRFRTGALPVLMLRGDTLPRGRDTIVS
ncbi:hypothetical protein DB31_1876 [Hyalangium minutum]|uniref:Uncharacterized protein n=1 Tax=Hyalangium minutum TaxID=394096 RepID=A0A085WAZ5_9BACT|nr:hypothetical protein DB31_1876 [Hyalangium minutum]